MLKTKISVHIIESLLLGPLDNSIEEEEEEVFGSTQGKRKRSQTEAERIQSDGDLDKENLGDIPECTYQYFLIALFVVKKKHLMASPIISFLCNIFIQGLENNFMYHPIYFHSFLLSSKFMTHSLFCY